MGYFLVFQAQKLSIRHDVHMNIINGIDDNRITTLHFNSRSEIVFDGENEIIFGETHYDVIRLSEHASGIIVQAVSDEKETSMHSALSDHITSHVQNHKNDSGKPPKSSDNKLFKLYITDHSACNFLAPLATTIVYPGAEPGIPQSPLFSIFLPPKIS